MSRSAWMPALLAAALTACGPAAAVELRPSWECLPAETAVMVRMPQASRFLETMRAKTRFGTAMLGEQRLAKIWTLFGQAMKKEGPAAGVTPFDFECGGEEFEKRLAKYSLEAKDIQAVFQQDLGMGMVVQGRREGRQPLEMALLWIEPGEDASGRMFAAAKQMLEEARAADAVNAPRRIDLEMAGHEVVMTVTPLMGIDPVALEGVSIDAADAKAVEEATRKVADRIREAKRVQTGQVVSFYARIGGRLLVGATMFNGATQAGAAAGEPRDWDAEGGTEEAKGVFERFLAAHAAGGDSPLADVLQTPGLRDALPAGEPLVDIVVDPRVFMKAYGEADDAAKQAIQKLKAVGLADIGPFAWRQSFDQGRYHNGMFLVLPGPRTGLMRILDQECDPSEVPSFVTSEAVGLTQLSLDLGKAYQTVREFAVAEIGEEAGNMFLAGEMQTQGWLGVDLPKLLSSLGSRHWMIDYPSRIAAAMAEGRGEGGATARLNQAASRGAFVWQVADEAPFLKILQRLAPMAGGELQEEQGFRGIRIPNGPAAAVGRNHLVVGLGDDSLENTVAGIRNLPAGAASLRESEAARKAGELLPQEPARMFALGDASRTGGILGNVREIVANLEADDVPENYREVLAAAKGVLPTADEMQGMFGVSAATMRATADGIAVRAVWEMPAP